MTKIKKKKLEVNEPVRMVRQLKDLVPWKVELKFNQPRVVMAKTEAGAWNKYKKMMGIRNTDHEPIVQRCPKFVKYDEETGIIKNLGATPVTKKEIEDSEIPDESDDDFDAVPYDDADDVDEEDA
jgi:hypothetical protein